MQADITYVPIVPPTELLATLNPVSEDRAEVNLAWNHELETDDFLRFVVYRDGVEIARPLENNYMDVITEAGVYIYTVSANYDEIESEESEKVEVIWDGTGVRIRMFDGVPLEYSIAAAYPNPFNPILSVVVGIPNRAELAVTIHNIMGQQVASLANGSVLPGYHTWSFNADQLSSGIYFVRAFVPGELNQVRKVVLMK